MKLLEFWEEISLMPDAVRQLETLEITEGEYEKLRELFLRDVNLFYEAVKKREDFRLVLQTSGYESVSAWASGI